jgi:hypothetical protein
MQLIKGDALAPIISPVESDGRTSLRDMILLAGVAEPVLDILRVRIDGVEVPAEMLAHIKPKRVPGSLITVTMAPMGDANDAWATVATVLLAVGVAAISGGALGGLGLSILGLTFEAGSLGAAIAAAALGLAGTALIGAVFPSAAIGGRNDQSEVGSAAISGNVLAPGDYLTRVFGTRRVAPRLVTTPIRTLDKDQEFIEALYALAGRTALSDIRVGGVPVSQIEGLAIEVVDHNSVQPRIGSLGRYGREVPFNLPLRPPIGDDNNGENLLDQKTPQNSVPAPVTVASVGDPDQVNIRLIWLEGLSNPSANTQAVEQPMRVRVKPRGSPTWLNLPEIVWKSNQAGIYRKEVSIVWEPLGEQPVIKSPKRTATRLFARVPGQGNYYRGDWTPNQGGSGYVAGTFLSVSGSGSTWTGTSITVDGSQPSTTSFWLIRPAGMDNGETISIDGGPALTLNFATAPATGRYYQFDIVGSSFDEISFLSDSNAVANVFAGLKNGLWPKTDPWVSDDRFVSGTIAAASNLLVQADQNAQMTDSGVVFSVTEALLPKGPLEIEVLAGAVVRSSDFNKSSYSMADTDDGDGFVNDFFWYHTRSDGTHRGSQNFSERSGKVSVQFVTSIVNASPALATNRDAAMIAIRGANLNVQELTVMATSVVRNRQSDLYEATNNPAVLAEALLRGENTNAGMAEGTLDVAAFDAWAAECTSKGYAANFEVYGMSVEDVLAILAASGWAGYSFAPAFGPYIEKDRSGENPVALFTPDNSRNFTMQKGLSRFRADALRVTFADENDDYLVKTIEVYGDGVTPASARAFENATYPGITSEAAAQARAALDLKMMRYRALKYELETDLTGLDDRIKRGALALVQYDILAEADATHAVNEKPVSQAAYVSAVTRNGDGEITGLTLDTPVYLEPTDTDLLAVADVLALDNLLTVGDPYNMALYTGLSGATDNVSTHVLTVSSAGETTSLTPATPFYLADLTDALIAQGGVQVSVARRTRISRRVIIEDVRPAGEGTFQITAVNEAPELHL